MGCAQSRIENEEAVARCKERRQKMKSAVEARNAFAAAHSAYAVSLRDAGAALLAFAHGEAHPIPSTSPSTPIPSSPPRPHHHQTHPSTDPMATPPPPSPMDLLPPPPLPFSPSPAKMARSISMPAEFQPPSKLVSRPPEHSSSSIREEEEEAEDEDEGEEHRLDVRHRRRPRHSVPAEATPPPPPPPMPERSWDYFFSMDESMASLAPEEEEGEIVPEEEEKYVPMSPPRPPPPLEEEEEPRTPEAVAVTPPPPSVLPPRPPRRKGEGKQNASHHQHAASMPSPMELKKGKMVATEAPKVNLLRVLAEIDENFLKASESASEVSKVLEANRMHYHSNFADTRGHIDHSARVMKIITWNKSFKAMQNGDDGKDDFENDEWETLATVVDKILAWEKKLYDEVKAGELMKMEYQRKVALLNKQKKHGAATEVLERTKAAVTHLHTRYIVDMQSMDSTVSEIQHLRDNQLYPKLLDLADRMAKMWEAMYSHHERQLKIMLCLKSVDISHSTIETSDHHHNHTRQLREIADKWGLHFTDVVLRQKEYISSLYSWLKLNLIPIESSLKEKVTSPPRAQEAPIKALLQAWNEHLTKLPDDLAKTGIDSFRAVLDTILSVQEEELTQRQKCEEIRKEYSRKSRAFEDWQQKYWQRKTASSEAELENGEATGQKDPFAEKKFLVDALKSRLDDEDEVHNKLSKQVREKSLTILKAHLPELFRALSEFSHHCREMYSKLRLISLMQEPAD